MESEARSIDDLGAGQFPGIFGMGRPKPLPMVQRIQEHPSWPILAKVPEKVTALVPLARFTVHELLTMEKGRVFETSVPTTDMIPIKVGSVQIAWAEFEVVEYVLALRVNKLA